jgi:hypothetical protein
MKNVGGWHSFYQLSFLYKPLFRLLLISFVRTNLSKRQWLKLVAATVAIMAVATKSQRRFNHTQ